MYQSLVVIRPKKKGRTMKEVIDEAFGKPKGSYSVVIVPEPATGHAEHDATIFEPKPHHTHGHEHSGGGSSQQHEH